MGYQPVDDSAEARHARDDECNFKLQDATEYGNEEHIGTA
jgi:hypothetical protein